MKIDYTSITKTERDWKVGDVIHDAAGYFYLVSEVTGDDRIFYTLIDLETGASLLGYTDNIRELQNNYDGRGDRILNGTFKYIDD